MNDLALPASPRIGTAALGLLVGLGACAAPDAPAKPPAPSAEPQVAAEDPLPDSVTGTFDATEAACAKPLTMSRLTVSTDTLEFYYGYATVDSVTARDAGYDIAATLYQLEGAIEVVPEALRYRIEPRRDSLLFGAVLPGHDPALLVRCSAQ